MQDLLCIGDITLDILLPIVQNVWITLIWIEYGFRCLQYGIGYEWGTVISLGYISGGRWGPFEKICICCDDTTVFYCITGLWNYAG